MTKPKKWYEVTSCGYDAPEDPFVETILNQNIKGERCAIGFYKKLIEATQSKDPVTYNIVLQILQDEWRTRRISSRSLKIWTSC